MNHRVLLLSSAAAIALTSNAWAAQGDTYISLFGGFSSGSDVDLVQTRSDTAAVKVTEFNRVRRVQNYFTVIGSETLIKSYVIFGTLSRTYTLTDTEQWSGSVGSDGWVVGGALGVELPAGFRGEAEAAFRRADVNDGATLDMASLFRHRRQVNAYYNYKFSVTAKGVGSTVTSTNLLVSNLKSSVTSTRTASNLPAMGSGEFTSFSLMANLWYDFPIGDTGLTPFIGAGIGVSNLSLSYEFQSRDSIPRYIVNQIGGTKTKKTSGSATYTVKTPTTTTTMRRLDTEFKDDAAAFAYQFGAGIGYEFDNGIRLAAQYRYFATAEADFGNQSHKFESSDVLFSLSFPLGGGR